MKTFCSLSEAMRQGAKIRPQGDALFMETETGAIKSCALGAAYEAMTGQTILSSNDAHVYRAIENAFPYICGERVQCPAGCYGGITVESTIIHLNDDHGWTREQIADFLEKFEESIGYVTLVESESSSESLPAAAVVSV